MSVVGGRMRMDLALKDLRTRWNRVVESWDDPVSRSFEENYIVTLENAARLAGAALDKMREAVARAKRECEDR
jgi:hypothetical protein